MAGEQSTGTFVPIPGETDELKARSAARIETLEECGAADAPGLPGARPPADGEPIRRARVTLSWPLDNIGPSLPNLLATVAGNLFELAEFSGLRLLDIRLPTPFADAYTGPKFGIAGTRDLAGVHERPLIGTIIKPSIGFSPDETAALVRTLVDAGIDFIKDDELQSDGRHCPFDERVRAAMRVVNEDAERTGRKVMTVAAGLASAEAGAPVNPYVGNRFAVAAVTTDFELAADRPLAPLAGQSGWRAKGPAWWFGKGFAKNAINREPFARRRYVDGAFPFEKLQRVAKPTTFIDEDRVARVPKRTDMAYGLKIAGTPKAEIEERVNKAAEMLQLGDYLKRRPRELSGGQRQRVAMLTVLAWLPAVIFSRFFQPLKLISRTLSDCLPRVFCQPLLAAAAAAIPSRYNSCRFPA